MIDTKGTCHKCGILIKDSICEINSGVTYISHGHELCENCHRELSLIECFDINKPNHIKIGEKLNTGLLPRYCGKPTTKKLIYNSKYNKIYKLLTRFEFVYFNRYNTKECVSYINKTRKYWDNKTDNDILIEMREKDIAGWASELFRRLYREDRIKICDRFLDYIKSNEIYYLIGNNKAEMKRINEFFDFEVLIVSETRKRYVNNYFKEKDAERLIGKKKENIRSDIKRNRQRLRELRESYIKSEQVYKAGIIDSYSKLKNID